MMLRANFRKLVDRAMSSRIDTGLRPVVEKELLHYDILFLLAREGFLDRIVFQGGTCLRLCHGSDRYSEDLDFAGGPGFDATQLTGMADALRDWLGDRYGIDVAVKAPKPKHGGTSPEGILVDKWQVSVTTSPERPDLPRQRIKIEVASVPAHESELMVLKRNYDVTPAGYHDVLLRTESLDEVLADKLLAFPVVLPGRPRHRDIWDIEWLRQQGARIRPDLIQRKIEDYRVSNYPERLEDAIARAGEVIGGAAFSAEMSRFLSAERVARTFGRSGFKEYLARRTREVFEDVRSSLDPESRRDAPDFEL